MPDLSEVLPCTCGISEDVWPLDMSHPVWCEKRARAKVQAWHEAQVAEKDARITELEDVLATALPYVESAEADPAYKRGAVATVTKKIRAALPQEGEACGRCGGSGNVPAEIDTPTGPMPCPYIGEPCPDCGEKP